MIPLTRDLVLLGGGHAHALVLRRWGMDPLPGARLTLVDPGPVTAYTGMLPGHVAGHYDRAEIEIDLVRLARFAGARMVLGAAGGIDADARTVEVPGRPPIAYDVLSIDVGVTSAPDIPGYAAHAHPVKPFGPFATGWEAFRASGGGPAAVIGGGVAGCELALAMAHALGARGSVTVIERGEILSGVTRAAARRIRAAMDRCGIEVAEGARIARIEADAVHLEAGAVPSCFTAGAAGATPWAWLARTPLETRDGYVAVGPDLASLSHPDVFAVGDCAALTHAPRPKAGVYAVRAAPVLHRNLRAALSGGARKRFDPQSSYLKLVSLGERAAVADRGPLALGGRALWRLKDRIDRRFMDKLTDLPRMAPRLPDTVAAGVRGEIEGRAMLCAGCGSKVGPGVLSAALADMPGHAALETGPGDDAAILLTGGARQAISTDHLRALWDDPFVMARIAAVHALGDVWSMGAAPQAALLQVTLPRMSQALQARTLAEVMAGLREVLEDADYAIAGGHTAMGAEMQIGLTVTGLTEAPIRVGGGRAGDVLVLTKPIGTGTVMAAEMRGAAGGREVAEAVRWMQRPQGDAARILGAAHAMTDVTGFGLAGHLLAICEASGLAARLDLGAVPLLPGAERLADAGIRSTAWAANRADAGARIDPPDTARGALLFDPQTAGGLLAAVDAEGADALVARLREAGHEPAVIGALGTGPPRIDL